MKFVEPNIFADLNVAARKLAEIANGICRAAKARNG
jgi:hypothetical protein